MKAILLLFIISCPYIFAQDISGKWFGILSQEPNREYYFELTVIKEEGNNVSGTTIIRENTSGNYGIISYKGNFENNRLYFQETKILKQDKSKDDGYWKSNTYNWCIKSGLLKLSQTHNEMKFEGPWSSKTGSCSPGKIVVVKKKEHNKKHQKINDCLDNPPSANFLLGIWTGRMHQYSCNVDAQFNMLLHINKVDGLKFNGVFIWPANNYNTDSRSSLRGEIKDGKILLYEEDIISGDGLVLDGIYECSIVNCDSLKGFWRLDKYQTDCDQPNVLKDGGNYKLKHYKVPTIYFDHNSSDFRQKTIDDLDELALFLKEFKSLKIQLEGHTDNTGSNARNLNLSKQRSTKVMNYLVQKGISENRLNSKHFGSLSPITSNTTKKGKELNRRTEIIIQDE